MSAPAERDAVHAELGALLGPGGRLHWDPRTAHPLLDDESLIARVARRYRARAGLVTQGGAAAVITAGPPGAGKSTAITTIGDLEGYFRIDPDEIKDLLLDEGASRGLLDDADGVVLGDGRPVMARELSARAHKVSTDVADTLRDEAMALRENIVIEGTLTWPGLPDELAPLLVGNHYEQLRIVDVEVPAHAAIEQARGRWWSCRVVDPLGGRYMSDDDVLRSYEQSTRGQGRSRCADVAEDLFERVYDVMDEAVLVRRESRGGDRDVVQISERVAYGGRLVRDTLD